MLNHTTNVIALSGSTEITLTNKITLKIQIEHKKSSHTEMLIKQGYYIFQLLHQWQNAYAIISLYW